VGQRGHVVRAQPPSQRYPERFPLTSASTGSRVVSCVDQEHKRSGTPDASDL